METAKIFDELETTISEFSQLLSSFDEDSLNQVPFEGSWTAGQVAKHVIMSGSGFVQLINGPVKDTDRAPDAGVETIKSTFLNFDIKLKSPEFIVPPETIYKKQELLNALTDIRSGVKNSRGLDLEKTCTARELPALGLLTRFEALNFMLYHTQRHLHQLKNVSKKVLSNVQDSA
jgi:hypothetical protein